MYRTYSVYDTSYDTGTGVAASMSEPVALVILICALVAALLIFFLVARAKDPAGGFVKKMKNFLNFKDLIIDGIIEFFYIFMAIIVSVSSIYTMFQFNTVQYSVLVGLAGLVIGNIVLRLGFELIMLLVGLWQNTSDIYKLLEEKHGVTHAQAKEMVREMKAEKKAETKKD